jgi:hypothetical protein
MDELHRFNKNKSNREHLPQNPVLRLPAVMAAEEESLLLAAAMDGRETAASLLLQKGVSVESGISNKRPHLYLLLRRALRKL